MLATLMLLLGQGWLGVILVVWSLMVCLARVGMGVHYVSDVAAGILLGIAYTFGFFALVPWFTTTFPIFF